MNPYAFKKIKCKNLRCIDNIEINFENDTGLYRVIGRNGRGKSTIFSIGLNILCGTLPALPELQKGKDRAYYEITNGFGTFGFQIVNKKVGYYYTLNTGENDISYETVNHNPCIEVIRSYLGFDMDLDFKSILNVNCKDELNFIVTNGRTSLGFLKGILYSEEIERLQKDYSELENVVSQRLKTFETEINYVYRELDKEQAKLIKPDWLQNQKDMLYFAENLMVLANNLKSNLNDVLNLKQIYYGIKKQLEKDIFRTTVQLLIEFKVLIQENQRLNILSEKLNVKSLANFCKEYKYVQFNISTDKLLDFRQSLINPLYDNIYSLKEIQYSSIREDYVNCLDKFKEMKTYAKLYKNTILESENLIIVEFNKILKNFFIRLKIGKEVELKIKTMQWANLKEIFKNFANETSSEKRFQLEIFKCIFGGLILEISSLKDIKEKISGLEKELEEKIYKDGRCILCLSKKSDSQK